MSTRGVRRACGWDPDGPEPLLDMNVVGNVRLSRKTNTNVSDGEELFVVK